MKRNGRLNEHYFLWLLQQVEWYEIDAYDYKDLLFKLHNITFTWLIGFDSNRAAKGISLRYEWNRSFDGNNEPCSVLEMLIALARDWEHELTYDFKKGDRSAMWFWVMIENLGLLDGGEIEEKVSVWLNREFDKSGNGSPFPLKRPHRDQRKIQIWFQVNDFVMENVEI